MKSKRLYFDKKKSKKYCVVKLFKTKKEMQEVYRKSSPSDNGHYKVLGVHQAYTKWELKKPYKLSNETGTVFLSLENCGAGVVCHELMHAVLWSNGHNKYKKQFPIVIKNMAQEEKLLHRLSEITMQFYNWYWKVKSEVKKSTH